MSRGYPLPSLLLSSISHHYFLTLFHLLLLSIDILFRPFTLQNQTNTMASVMLFPNVATHRRMPHLSKEPKESKLLNSKPSKDDLSVPSPHSKDGVTPWPAHDHPSDTNDAVVDTLNGLSLSGVSHLTIASPGTSSNGQNRLLQDCSPSESKASLTINTTRTSSSAQKTLLTVPSSEAQSEITSHTDVSASQGSQKQHGQDDALQGHPAQLGHQQQLQPNPLNGPHGQSCSSPSLSAVATPLSALPPLGVITASSSSQDSKMIKSALHDAFGCLYHPVQHTHHPSSSSSTCSTPHGKLSAALRSGEGTPSLGISPRASPMLRPHMGASAPITPLELTSADGHSSGGGYFGQNTTGSSSRHLHAQHHQPHHHNLLPIHISHALQSPHSHDSSRRAPSLHQDDIVPPKTVTKRPSLDLNLNPTEHPVLCSLQTLSLTHPHPPEHYHPHLGHDLGHDRIPVLPTEITPVTAQTPAQPQQQGQYTSSTQPRRAQTAALKPIQSKLSKQPLTPDELLLNTAAANAPGGSSLFPMDNIHGDASIGRLH
ncbi:hypothetical protein BC939DRAFT_290361 [Gamsiella multidivaricata]|uniref:uncharacterized protein n=1 Tax=Gamsiella multidivaricata TaxID=101098 RepID=UPI00221EEE8F|nr:uncharacterized protein BC939DRAFT_290361 [Gamsiella multidivaricata]KAI7818588.1 hypothetical protein BC939DRAFT_290361 [Gamsiella multidivaricata]